MRRLERWRFAAAPIASLTARGAGVLAGFLVTFQIGRLWGPEANGVYGLVTQTALFGSVVAVGGLDLAAVRHFSGPVARGRKVARSSLIAVLGAVLLLALGATGLVLGAAAAGALGRTGLPTGALMLGVLCGLAVLRAFTRVTAAILSAHRRYVSAQVVDAVIIPVVVGAGLLAALANVEQALTLTLAAAGAAALVGIGLSLRLTGGADAEAVGIGALMSASWPLWIVALSKNFADWYSLVVVSSQAGIYDAGLFRVAAQVAGALGVLSVGLLGVFSARLSVAHARGDMAAFAKIMRDSTRLSIVVTIPPVLLLAAAARPLLGFVGPEFVPGAPVMWVLLLGQAAGIITGPVGLALAMSGHQRVNLAIGLASILGLVVLAPLAAMAFGVLGVAATVAVAQALRNAACYVMVRRRLGVDGFRGTVLPR